MTFQEAYNDWWNDYSIGLSDTTIFRNNLYAHAYILPVFSEKNIQEISKKDIEDYRDTMINSGATKSSRGLAISTVRRLCDTIIKVLKWEVKEGNLSERDVPTIKYPPEKYKEVQVFSPTEIDKLISCARPKWMGDAIEIAYRTGMRRGEIYGLKWKDIDWDGHFLMVRRSVSALKPNDRRIHPPKTQRSIRRIQLDNKTIDLLKQRKNKAIPGTIWVFENQYGLPISPWYTTKYMAEACKSAGIPHRCFHTLRHTHATILLQHNVNPKIVQERLGHSDISMTLTIYSHVLPTMQDLAVNVFETI